jgi:hypothetical protein
MWMAQAMLRAICFSAGALAMQKLTPRFGGILYSGLPRKRYKTSHHVIEY